MPNFKPKASKKIVVNKKSIVTLDSKHNEKMIEFLDISNNILPSLRTEKHFLKKQLKTKTDIGEKLEIKDRSEEHTMIDSEAPSRSRSTPKAPVVTETE